MKAAPDIRTRTDGWRNICTRPVGNGELCLLPYWYLARKEQRVTVGPDGEPTTTPHVCRNTGNGGFDHENR